MPELMFHPMYVALDEKYRYEITQRDTSGWRLQIRDRVTGELLDQGHGETTGYFPTKALATRSAGSAVRAGIRMSMHWSHLFCDDGTAGGSTCPVCEKFGLAAIQRLNKQLFNQPLGD